MQDNVGYEENMHQMQAEEFKQMEHYQQLQMNQMQHIQQEQQQKHYFDSIDTDEFVMPNMFEVEIRLADN